MNARRIFVGVAFNYLGVVTVSLSGFIATPIIIHHLGHRVFGEWALMSAIIGYSALLDFGVGLTVMRLIAERAHLSDRTELNRISSTALVIYSGLGMVAMVASIVVALFARHLFHVPPSQAGEFTAALIILGVMMGITFPAGLYTGINQGFGRYRQQNLIVMAQSIGGSVGGIVAVLLGGGLLGLALSWCLFSAGAFIVKAVYAHRAYSLRPSFRRFDRSTARSLVGLSAWMFIINLAGKIIFDSDTVIIGGILGTIAVTQYSVGLGPATAVRRITDQFSSVSLTAASGLKAKDESEALRRLLLEATRMTVVVIAPFLVFFAAFGHQFLALWVGASLSSSAPTLVVLLVAMLASSVQAASGQVLVALGRQRRIAIIAVGEAVANLALSIALARPLGIIGVAIGTAIPTTITSFGIYVPYAARLVGIRPLAVARRLILPGCVAAVTYLIGFVLASALRFTSLIELAVFAAVFVGASIVASIALDPSERRTYLGLLTAWRHQPQSAR